MTDCPSEPAPPIRVVIADDHPVFLAGLRTLVEESPQLEYAGQAAHGAEAVQVCAAAQPDVVLMDIRMPGVNGIDATRQIVTATPGTGVLMLTMLEDDTSVLAAMRAGARGYILKGAHPDQILRAISAVAAGEVIFGAALAARMAAFFRGALRPDRTRVREPVPAGTRSAGSHCGRRVQHRYRHTLGSQREDDPQQRLGHLDQAPGHR